MDLFFSFFAVIITNNTSNFHTLEYNLIFVIPGPFSIFLFHISLYLRKFSSQTSFFTKGRNRRRETDFVDKPILATVANITILMARIVHVLLYKAKAVILKIL